MTTSSISWLRAAWAVASHQAELISHALTEKPGRLVVLPTRELTGAPSVTMLASLLKQAAAAFPAIVVTSEDLVEFHRAMLTEGLPEAVIAVVDWCHPTPPNPAQITLLRDSDLPRAAATLAGYRPATIAYFGRIEAHPDERRHRAFRSLLDAAHDPLILVEEWAEHGILVAALGRAAGLSEREAHGRLRLWLDWRLPYATSGHTHASTDQLLAVRDLCPRRTPAAA